VTQLGPRKGNGKSYIDKKGRKVSEDDAEKAAIEPMPILHDENR
jgi:hypothetical protein